MEIQPMRFIFRPGKFDSQFIVPAHMHFYPASPDFIIHFQITSYRLTLHIHLVGMVHIVEKMGDSSLY